MMGGRADLDMFRVPRPRRLLVLAPHPDDEAVGCGGYLAGLAERGTEITVLFVTDGDLDSAGRHDSALAARRRAESEIAAELLGIRRLLRWHLPDGELSGSEMSAEPLQSIVREHAIDMVLLPHVGESHPDHQAVARLVRRFEMSRSCDLTMMSYEVWTPVIPNRVVNIGSHMDRKLTAIRAYASQHERFNLEGLATGLARYRAAWSRMRWQFAEAFRLSALQEYKEGLHAD